MMLYNRNVDLVNENVFLKFGQILSFHSQDIEENQILKSINGSNYGANFRKNDSL